MDAYLYPPLNPRNNEIRLLYPIYQNNTVALQRKLSGDAALFAHFSVTPDLPLEFELRAASQNDEPVYTALSYVWGQARTPKHITVNGHAFPITESLETALLHMQFEDIEPAIWIDAVCIDQSNRDEKNDQVPRMSRIYLDARNVIVWLGIGAEYNVVHGRILNLIGHIGTVRFRKGWIPLLNKHDQSWSYSSHSDFGCQLYRIIVEAVDSSGDSAIPLPGEFVADIISFRDWLTSSLLASEWWYRIWTIQEFVLAKNCTFQIGLCRMEQYIVLLYPPLLDCIHHSLRAHLTRETRNPRSEEDMRSGRMIVPDARRRLPEILKLDRRKSQKFFDILLTSYCGDRYRIGCSDPRDRIFALCSLAEEDYNHLGIQTDYHKQAWEICIDVAQRMITSGNLDFLSYCRGQDRRHTLESPEPDRSPSNLPSWAANWTCKVLLPHYWCGTDGIGHTLFSASGNMTCNVSYTNHGTSGPASISHSLIFAAVLVDELTRVEATDDETLSAEDRTGPTRHLRLSRAIRAFLKVSRETCPGLYTTAQLREAVWRLPIWDHELDDGLNWRRATRLSKGRHDTHLLIGLHGEALARFDALSAVRGKHGVLYNIWIRVLMVQCAWTCRYRGARYVPYTEILSQRLLYWLYTALYMLFFRWTFFEPYIDSILSKAADSVSPYASTLQFEEENSLLMTQRGYIGSCSSTAKPGDRVYILLGSRVPHVLRRCDNGQAGYTLVGDAFVYGAMDGELMKSDTEQVKVEIF